MDNRTIAARLVEHAHFLENRGANLFRARAYRRAAETILDLNYPVAELVSSQGKKGLKELTGIGTRLAVAIEDLLLTGAISKNSGLHEMHEWAEKPANSSARTA